MVLNKNEEVRSWYEKSYGNQGFKAQRLYPNEELLRFMGRNYFNIPVDERKTIKVLEVGCGSCSNLWMLAKEGFEVYGIDISQKSLELGKLMLEKWGVNAALSAEDMTSMSFKNSFFDVIVDIFSSNCLDMINFKKYLSEVNRVLRTGGKFFLYTPSDKSEAFTNHYPAEKIDQNTLNGIYREDSPFYGNFYPFRFESIENLKKILVEHGFECTAYETISRTYKNGQEMFQHISLEAVKK
jgi:ubiquinone/menaquinone biosynthesis C-methylase UbiE